MAILAISRPVGKGQPNLPKDVRLVRDRLAQLGKLSPSAPAETAGEEFLKAIAKVQNHFMLRPDEVVSPGGATLKFLADWKEKPVSAGVQLPGRLREAWDLVSPLLPEGSYCSSGFRSAEEQRKILHKFYTVTYRAKIIAKYGQAAVTAASANLLANEAKVLAMVRGVGQAIAAPGASMHQKGKAVDIGGPPAIDRRQEQVVRLVAKANPALFSGKVLLERNGCVHFEIL